MPFLGDFLGSFSQRSQHYRDETARKQQAEQEGLFKVLTQLTGPEVDPQIRGQAVNALIQTQMGGGSITRKDLGGWFGQTEVPPHVTKLLEMVEGRNQAPEEPPRNAISYAPSQNTGYHRALPATPIPGEQLAAPVGQHEVFARELGTPSLGPPPAGAPGIFRDPNEMLMDQTMGQVAANKAAVQAYGLDPKQAQRVYMTKLAGSQPADPIEQRRPVNLHPSGVPFDQGKVITGSVSYSGLNAGRYFDQNGQPLPPGQHMYEVPDSEMAATQRAATGPKPIIKPELRNGVLTNVQYNWDPASQTYQEAGVLGNPQPQQPPPALSTTFTDSGGNVRGVTRGGEATGPIGTSGTVESNDMKTGAAVKADFARRKAASNEYKINSYSSTGTALEKQRAIETRLWQESLKAAGLPAHYTQADVEDIRTGRKNKDLTPRSQGGVGPPPAGQGAAGGAAGTGLDLGAIAHGIQRTPR